MTSATAGLMVTRSSISPGRVVRSRKKLSMSSGIMSLVISTEKHCCRVMFENGPTSWLMICVKSLLPEGFDYSLKDVLNEIATACLSGNEMSLSL